MQLRIRDKQSARKATMAAQAAVVVLVGAGFAMAALGPRLLEVEDRQAEAKPPQAGPAAAEQPEVAQHDFDELTTSENLSYLANTPQPDPEPEVEVAGETPAPPPSDNAEVRYVGAVRMGSRMAAFLNVGGVTRLLRPGQRHEQVELVSVAEDQVVVAIDGGPPETVSKAQREGPSVTLVVGGAPAPEPVPVVGGESPDSHRFTPDMSREERRAMLLERAREERSRWERDRDDRGEGRFPPDRIDN